MPSFAPSQREFKRGTGKELPKRLKNLIGDMSTTAKMTSFGFKLKTQSWQFKGVAAWAKRANMPY
jgi:hypothetical protein